MNGSTNANKSVYNPNFVFSTQDYKPPKLSFEEFSNKNSHAKYTKNLQFREKLPKKSERKHSTPSRLNEEFGEKNLITGSLETEPISTHPNASIDQYKSYLNNSNWQQESLYMVDTDNMLSSSVASKGPIVQSNFNKKSKIEMRTASISSSNISLYSESTSSKELIGWSYQKTRDGKLHNMTKDYDWKELYNSRYVNDRVEVELIEFKEEIEKKFKISKCKNYTFPRKQKHKEEDPAHKSVAVPINNTKLDEDQTDPILLSKNYVFDYKFDNKEKNKINKKNIDFFNIKQENVDQPKRLTLLKTFDEDNKHQLSKSVPRANNNNSKPRKSKHKRQVTQFKFDGKDNNSLDRAKYLMKTNSN